MLKKSFYSLVAFCFCAFTGFSQERDPLNLTALMASPNTVYEVQYKDGDIHHKTLCYLRASFKPNHVLLYVFDSVKDSYKNIEISKSAILTVRATDKSIGRYAEEQQQSSLSTKKIIIGGAIAGALIGGIFVLSVISK